MAHRHSTSSYHDPLNLVRVPRNHLEQDALSVMQTMQQQKSSMPQISLWKDEFDEIENNLDKWKQKRRTSVSKTTFETTEHSPSSSYALQSNTDIKSSGEVEDLKTTGRSIIADKKISAKMNSQLQQLSKETINDNKKDKEVHESVRQVDKKQERNLDEYILRSKPYNKQTSVPYKPNKTELSQPLLKTSGQDVVQKSENRFKNAKAFFEQNVKPEEEVGLKSKRSHDANKINKRMSWAPGMIEKSQNRQSFNKLSIANDKEFTIEEIDLSKPKSRMSINEVKKINPRFVPNIKTYDDVILRKKDTSSNERKSRIEVISVDFSDKTAPEISLDDFKGIIRSPEATISEENTHSVSLPKEKKQLFDKETIFMEDKNFEVDERSMENQQISKYSSNENIIQRNEVDEIKNPKQNTMVTSFGHKATNNFQKEGHQEGYKAEDSNKQFENKEYKYERGFVKYGDPEKSICKKNVDVTPERNLQTKSSKEGLTKDTHGAVRLNESVYSAVSGENIADSLKRRMEDRKAFFNSGSYLENKSETTSHQKPDNKPLISIESHEPLIMTKKKSNIQTENPFKVFEETYKSQLEELNERKTRDNFEEPIMKVKENVGTKIRNDEVNENSNLFKFQTEHTFTSAGSNKRLVGQDVAKKVEESMQIKFKEAKLPSMHQIERTYSPDSNFIAVNSQDVTEGSFMSKQNFKIESKLQKKELFPNKDVKIETKIFDNKSDMLKERSKVSEQFVKQTTKAVPTVPPKPVSKTSKIIDQLSFTGFSHGFPAAGLPRRSKSMKILRTCAVAVVDEVGVDFDEDFKSNNKLDNSAQKSRSDLARRTNRRPPSMYQNRARLTKTQTFDCSNGLDLEISNTHNTISQASQRRFSDNARIEKESPSDDTSNQDNLNHSTYSDTYPVNFLPTTPMSHSNEMRKEQVDTDEESSV